jgi:formamidase
MYCFLYFLFVSNHKLMLIDHRRAKAIWDFEGIFCSSRHIPHVRFAGLIHPGILGCAPSAEVLAEWNRREGELISTNTVADRIVAQPPNPKNAHGGTATEDVQTKIAKEGARTIPVRNMSSNSEPY